MRTLKLWFGLIGALVPIVYCGYLTYYFLDVSGSVEEAKSNGLGPTLLGLAIVGLFFLIPLTMKMVRLLSGPRSPGSGGRGGSDGPTNDGGIDADAMVARYLASRPTEAAVPGPWTQPPGPQAAGPEIDPRGKTGSGPAGRQSFGRRTR